MSFLIDLWFDYWNSFYAAAVGVVLTFMAFFLFRDFVLKIILQQGQRISSVSNHTSHQLQRFSPN
tara:strand:- start:403 stop:597 length:195 start_codon:yes stop_codon:yes gene_type:complete